MRKNYLKRYAYLQIWKNSVKNWCLRQTLWEPYRYVEVTWFRQQPKTNRMEPNTCETCLKPGLHLHTNRMRMQTTHVDESWCRMYGTLIYCLAFTEAANRPYINVLYGNFFWYTGIAFGCLPNVRRTAECCLPRFGNTSTSNVRIIFKCCALFAFRCKPGITEKTDTPWRLMEATNSPQNEIICWSYISDLNFCILHYLYFMWFQFLLKTRYMSKRFGSG